jgi:hypothetical protein
VQGGGKRIQMVTGGGRIAAPDLYEGPLVSSPPPACLSELVFVPAAL